MANIERGPNREVPFCVTNPQLIPAERYYDEDFYKLECEKLWPHVWQMACRLEQIPNVGDWIEYSNIGKSVIVVRTNDGVKAYHNACRHRGAQLVRGHGNSGSQGFTCPFHGWRWSIDGNNTFVYARHLFDEKVLDKAELALRPCRVELWIGCAFINFDNDAPSIRDSVGPLAASLDAYQTDKMRAEWCYTTILPANWKIAMEAFMEGYHVMRTHPQLHNATPGLYTMTYGPQTEGTAAVGKSNLSVRENIQAQYNHLELISRGMAGMCHAKDLATAKGILDADLPEDPAQAIPAWYELLTRTVVQHGRARGEPTPDLIAIARDTPVKPVEFIFPHFFLLPLLSSMAASRIRPLGPESCQFEIWSLTLFPPGEEPPRVEPVFLPHDSDKFPPIPQQDYANIPRQQIGLHTEGFEHMRLAKNVEGMISNYQRLIDGYLAGTSLEKLAKATAVLSGNFDGPIVDLDI